MMLPHSHTAGSQSKDNHERHFSFAKRTATQNQQQDDAGARKLADYHRQLSEHTRRLE